GMRGIPGVRRIIVAQALAIGVADHRRALRAARPVLAGAIRLGPERGAVRLRSRQHVVTVRLVADAVADLAFFSDIRLLGEIIAGAVQIGDVLGDNDAFGVLPWSLADAVARVHRGLAVRGLGRQIGVPDFRRAKTCGLRQLLAMVVGAGEAAEIAAVADPIA